MAVSEVDAHWDIAGGLLHGIVAGLDSVPNTPGGRGKVRCPATQSSNRLDACLKLEGILVGAARPYT